MLLLVLAVAVPNSSTFWHRYIVKRNYLSWFILLELPSWSPPRKIFGYMWLMYLYMYTTMGIASYLVYRAANEEDPKLNLKAKITLASYFIQLLLNWAWVPIFFEFQLLDWSFIEGIALVISVIMCACLFYRMHRFAGILFVPYTIWVCYAVALNYEIYLLNPEWSE